MELVVVIVVIGILAALTIGGYNGIQTRARDSTRVSDMTNIGKAMEIYKSRNGSFPQRASAATSWAQSNTYPNDYITGLHGYGQPLNTLPVDPTNTSTYYYRYYVYAAGSNYCDPNLGSYYVLMVMRMESIPSGSRHPDSPGFACSNGTNGRDWGAEGAWAQGGFLNG